MRRNSRPAATLPTARRHCARLPCCQFFASDAWARQIERFAAMLFAPRSVRARLSDPASRRQESCLTTRTKPSALRRIQAGIMGVAGSAVARTSRWVRLRGST